MMTQPPFGVTAGRLFPHGVGGGCCVSCERVDLPPGELRLRRAGLGHSLAHWELRDMSQMNRTYGDTATWRLSERVPRILLRMQKLSFPPRP